ncbi:MAG: ATP-binding protein [Bacteroidia bacterium]
MKQNKVYRRATLVAIAVLIFNQLFIQYWLYQKGEDALLINIGGRQRMLSQRIMVKALLYHETPSEEALVEIKTTVKIWSEFQAFLIEKLESAFFLYNRAQTISRLKELNSFIEISQQLIPEKGTVSDTQLQKLSSNQESFLEQMDLLVSLMQQDSDKKLSMIVTIEILFALLSLFLIYYEITYVFKKITLRLSHQNEGLIESNELLEQYAHLASHDLRSPIQNIINFSKLLFRRLKSDLGKDELEFLNYIVDASKRLKQTTSNLLKVATINQHELTFNAYSPQIILQAVLEDLDAQILQTQAQISISHLPNIIQGDQHTLHLVFQNLIANSLKFVEEGSTPKIEISYSSDQDQHVFLIKDHGIGISPTDQKQIFEIYRRVNEDGQFEGMGMGLAICLRMIRKHYGNIELESSIGKGSVFKVRFPKVIEKSALETI